MRDAVVFNPEGLFVRHNGKVEEMKSGKFFENALLPIEVEGVPLVWDLFRAIEHMKKHEVKTLGQMARMNIFEFLAEMEEEPKDGIPEELHAVEVRRVVGPGGFEAEVSGLGKEHEAGNRYSIELYPVNAIREIPIIVSTSVDIGGRNLRHDFTALEFFTTALWFIGWYSSPGERDKAHESLLAKAKERKETEPTAHEKEVTIQ